MQSLSELNPGQFLGRYELLMPVAQGGMASVWAARLRGTRGFQRLVAIKTILPRLSDDPLFEQMFLDEAGLASRINHPNVVQVLDLGEENGLLYQAMEWIEGEALSALVHDAPFGRGLPHPIAVKIMIGVCQGLHAAHELRDENGELFELVHRDMSPQNILVSADGVPKVVDFGVAKARTLSSVRTANGTFKGKPAYISPEQIVGESVDRRSDIFALGVVLYLATTGKHPFRGESDMATLHKISSEAEADPPSSVFADYPKALEEVVCKAIRKDQASRFSTAAEMARALQQAMPEVMALGDTDVAAWMRESMPARLDERKRLLRKAMKDADVKGSNPPLSATSSRPGFDSSPGTGLFPREAMAEEPTPGTLRGIGSTVAPEQPVQRPKARVSVVSLALGAVLVLAGFLGLMGVLMMHSNKSVASSVEAQNAPAAVTSSAVPPVPTTATALHLSEPEPSAISADSLPVAGKTLDAPAAKMPQDLLQKSKPMGSSVALARPSIDPPKKVGGAAQGEEPANVPAIRDPGF